ncbi:rhodanese-like domain-containing protein [Paenibacillus rigui]|uniref:rhodanese-like domain-containing protein n=1 Tax=Paenibacillus rigui TaxID=554312 RepID=UPI0015C584EE|nr:rhodanese-like domain-containing protein [Paenibacillus rigui]
MFKYSIILFIIVYFIQWIRPVKGLKTIDVTSLANHLKDKSADFKILDVRDQVDFYAGHIEGAFHISLGRLPYVKKREFHLEDEIIIVADSKHKSKKAARVMKKNGFKQLSYLENGMQAYQKLHESANHKKFQGAESPDNHTERKILQCSTMMM